MPLVQTRGAASAQGFGEFAQATAANYIEDVFSTYLYTGTAANQTITNGIDLSTKGGLVWIKVRSGTYGTGSHTLFDTVRGVDKQLFSNSTGYERSYANTLTAFNSNGFNLGSDLSTEFVNPPSGPVVSWTFREQAKFFDVVTYTGTGSNTTIAHSLGSVPGSIIVKRTDTTAAWAVYHRSLANTQYMVLNTTAAVATGATWWNSTTPTSAVFSVGTDASVNASGGTYVAYLFAHDAGGFGLAGTDNVISCGSYTGSSSDVSINLGYEAQWILVKNTSRSGTNWQMLDIMRGMPLAGTAPTLAPNLSDVESGLTAPVIVPTATGVKITGGLGFSINYNGDNYIYIAIRRGPMKVPTLGTSVFAPNARVGTGAASAEVTNISFPPDMSLTKVLNANNKAVWFDRLRGPLLALVPSDTAAEQSIAGTLLSFNMNGISIGNTGETTYDMNYTRNYVDWFFRRAPGFFDEVCYTGTGSNTTFTHNLGAVPELIIVKSRSLAQNGVVYTASTGNANYLRLFSTSSDSGETPTSFWNSTTPTSSVFSVGTANNVNGNTYTYVAYLFATCAGVSKVGSYAGTGSTQTINCGFTGGARFVLIKKSTSTAPDRDWYVWDTARGMTSGTDPSLKINTTAAEVNANDIYTITTGFQIVSSLDYVNASGVTYIFLAIA